MIMLVLVLHVHFIGMIITGAFFKVFFPTIIIQQRKALLASLLPSIFAVMSLKEKRESEHGLLYEAAMRKRWVYRDEQLFRGQSTDYSNLEKVNCQFVCYSDWNRVAFCWVSNRLDHWLPRSTWKEVSAEVEWEGMLREQTNRHPIQYRLVWIMMIS